MESGRNMVDTLRLHVQGTLANGARYSYVDTDARLLEVRNEYKHQGYKEPLNCM